MKTFIKNNWFKILIILLLVGAIFYLKSGRETLNVKEKFIGNDLSSATQITCTYPRVLNVSYLNGEISNELPEPETNPIVSTFSQLDDPEVGQMSTIDATRSIASVPIYKTLENEDKFIYIDTTGENYLSTYTIYKKQGVSVYTKTVDIVGIPSGSLAIGSCVGY